MGNLVFGSGAEPGRASKARGRLTESPMERDYDATESDRERHTFTTVARYPRLRCHGIRQEPPLSLQCPVSGLAWLMTGRR